MSNHHFHWSAGRLLFYYYILFHFHSVPGRSFCISGRETCMSAHHFHWSAGPFTILLFTISFPFGSRQKFLHLGSRNLNVEPPFSLVGRPFTILLLYTISFPFGSRQKFLHLGSRNLNVEPPFSLVGRTVYYSTIYYFISVRFQAEVFASRVAKPECRTTIFTGRPAVYYSTTIYYFISIRFQAEVFASRVAKPACRLTISFPFGFRQRFLHLDLNVQPPFSPVGQTLPNFFCISDNQSCMSAHGFACRPNVSHTGSCSVAYVK